MIQRKVVAISAVAALAAGAIALIGKPSEGAAKNESGSSKAIPGIEAAHVARPPAVTPTSASTNQTPTVRGTLPYVLTSDEPFTKPLRLAAEALGAKTVSVVTRHAVLVEVDEAARARLAADGRFKDVSELPPSGKVQPALSELVSGGAKAVDVSIVSLAAEDRERIVACLEAGGGAMLAGCINEGETIRARLPSELVSKLALRGDVRWMEKFSRPQQMNDKAVEPQAMNVRTVWDTHGLTGAGQKISTSDTGIDTGNLATMHRDLRNRVKDIKIVGGCITNDATGHGTHTAGSIVGDGTESGGKIRGVAYEADLYAWFCSKGDGEIFSPNTLGELYTAGGAWTAYVHSASWARASKGEYNTECANHDAYAWSNPEFLPVFAAGNTGSDACSIGSPGAAKNVLTVGATQSLRTGHDSGWGNGNPVNTAAFSSRGPCQDGRTKPDVAAPGTGVLSTRTCYSSVSYPASTYETHYAYNSGTSMACPLTAGSVALVRQWLIERKGFADEAGKRPTAALMKAVVMGGAKGAAVPDNDQGWGRVDLEETLFPSGGRAVKLVDRIPFEQGFVTNIIIETTNAAPLDVQLVWVDYPGSAAGDQSASRLVNDIDLNVYEGTLGGGASLRHGNGGEKPDTLNNAESVRIANAAATKYVITVHCKSILHDHTEGGAAALYIRGAFDPEADVAFDGGPYTETLDGIPWTFMVADGKARVGGVNAGAVPKTTTGAVAIPSTLGGYPVVGVFPFAFSRCNGLTSVTVPESVSHIDDYAFWLCGGLTNVAFCGHAPTVGSDVFTGFATGCTATVYEGTSGWDDDGNGKWNGLTLAYRRTPDPVDGVNPTREEIADMLDNAADPRLAASITNVVDYVAYRTWAETVKNADGQAAGAAAVRDAPNAWLAFALGSEKLIEKTPEDGDVKVEAFEPAADGAFAFTVSVRDVEVGASATAENLKSVFGIEGGTSLEALSPGGVDVVFGTPADGKVKFTAKPRQAGQSAYFMRVRISP